MTNRDIITQYFEDAKKSLIENYQKKGLKASGKFEKSLSVSINEQPTSIKAVIRGARHSEFMEIGRRPNQSQTLQAVRGLGKILEQWVIDKGLVGRVNPYAAAHKIVHEGIKIPNRYNVGGVISDTINKAWVEELSDKLMFNTITGLRSDIYKLFNE